MAMKLTNTAFMKPKSGMTFLELMVLILVLLSLFWTIFIGARVWKEGSDNNRNETHKSKKESDKAGCILNIRNVQQAMRSHANLNNIAIGETLLSTSLIGPGLYMETTPKCPGDKAAYTFGTVVPAVGTLYATCGNATDAASHVPTTYGDW